ncbi:TPA: hypothetical protein U5D76_000731 [Yersinia enterocolitica]|uniref:hypothetical protein n=1 Tax=Yersinia TaxID=629 RepID=UPI0005186164|nr:MULTISPECIES: hypothetical protein [Yersinia]PEH52581.1 hypothetical protein CRM81_03985 [Yersinia kristensenii]HEN3373675.1 hypothetical protein [Yersinia enterocolitica]
MTERERILKEIALDALKAFDCAKRGQSHPRIYKHGYVYAGMLRRINTIASMNPPLPKWMTEERESSRRKAISAYFASLPESNRQSYIRTSNTSGRGGFGD